MRGKYFFGVDQALQGIDYEENEDVPNSVLKIILNHVIYTIRTLKRLPETYANVSHPIHTHTHKRLTSPLQYYQGTANPDMTLTHLQVAIAHGNFEVLQLMLHILG